MRQQHVNYLINTWVLPVKTWMLIACDTAFYAIIVVYRFKCMALFHSQTRGHNFFYKVIEGIVTKKKVRDKIHVARIVNSYRSQTDSTAPEEKINTNASYIHIKAS